LRQPVPSRETITNLIEAEAVAAIIDRSISPIEHPEISLQVFIGNVIVINYESEFPQSKFPEKSLHLSLAFGFLLEVFAFLKNARLLEWAGVPR